MFSKQSNSSSDRPVALDSGDQKLVYYSKNHGVQRLQAIGKFEPFYWGDAVVYICGRRGSGKSTYANLYIKNYVKATDKRVFFMSRFEEDPSVQLPERSMRLSLEDIDEYDFHDMNDSLIVIDDINNAQLTPKQIKSVKRFIGDVIENSRHINTSIVMTSHLCSSYSSTRSILNEASSIVVYPQFSNQYFIEQCLTRYYGLKKDSINHILTITNSRWININTIEPKFILTEKEIFTL